MRRKFAAFTQQHRYAGELSKTNLIEKVNLIACMESYVERFTKCNFHYSRRFKIKRKGSWWSEDGIRRTSLGKWWWVSTVLQDKAERCCVGLPLHHSLSPSPLSPGLTLQIVDNNRNRPNNPSVYSLDGEHKPRSPATSRYRLFGPFEPFEGFGKTWGPSGQRQPSPARWRRRTKLPVKLLLWWRRLCRRAFVKILIFPAILDTWTGILKTITWNKKFGVVHKN